jgi:hypothetical protein
MPLFKAAAGEGAGGSPVGSPRASVGLASASMPELVPADSIARPLQVVNIITPYVRC